uniref:AlNc14C571G12178 protein n=1 Tax=Albugo laibachii Nc14 TaxID=890382 RepID=F0X184_9STRA|nr:AlNc14C571G12178 [Albugo laibachii Nc14]|eukprot:CCA27542.1 AlNc14C571G12178 [Albugo laibachii Nc14]
MITYTRNTLSKRNPEGSLSFPSYCEDILCSKNLRFLGAYEERIALASAFTKCRIRSNVPKVDTECFGCMSLNGFCCCTCFQYLLQEQKIAGTYVV